MTTAHSGTPEKPVHAEKPAAATLVPAKKSKRRKKLHKVERGMSKALRRYSEALLKGADRYDELSAKSAAKKKDGAVKDYGKNLYKAVKLAMKGTKKAPKSFYKAITPFKLRRKQRRPFERSVGAVAKMMGL